MEGGKEFGKVQLNPICFALNVLQPIEQILLSRDAERSHNALGLAQPFRLVGDAGQECKPVDFLRKLRVVEPALNRSPVDAGNVACLFLRVPICQSNRGGFGFF